MFGNRLIYNQSPGGKRRGLIYQSSENGGIFVDENRIYFGTSGNNLGSRMSIKFKKNGNIVVEIPNGWFTSQNAWTADTSKIVLSDKWYPLSITPIYKMKFANTVIDMNEFDSVVSMTNKFMFKKETFTAYGYDGSVTNLEFLVLYYDITNIPIITSANNSYYDFRGLETGHDFIINNAKLKYDITKELLFEFEGNIKYFTYMADQLFTYQYPSGSGSAVKVGGLNALNDGISKSYGRFAKYKERSPLIQNILEFDSFNSLFYRLEYNGSAGIKLDGTPGSDGYYLPILYGAPRIISVRMVGYDKNTHQETGSFSGDVTYKYGSIAGSKTMPSGIPTNVTGGGRYSMILSDYVFRLVCPLFEVPAFFVGSNVIVGLTQLKPTGETIEFDNPYDDYGSQGIELPNLNERLESDYNFQN